MANRLKEIKIGFLDLRDDLQDYEASDIGLEKQFTHLEELIIETLLEYKDNKDMTSVLNNFISLIADIKRGGVNVLVDYPYIIKNIEHILVQLQKLEK